MSSSKPAGQLSQTRNILSLLLFALAAALLAFAAYTYIENRNGDEPPPPPNLQGKAELKNVHDVLVAKGLKVEYGREGARVEDFTPAGQQLVVDDQSLFVFIFASVDAREREMAIVNPENLDLVDVFGDAVTTEPVSIGQSSNVVTVLVGADSETQQAIDEALATLP